MMPFSPLRISAPGQRVCFWGAPVEAARKAASYEEQLTASGGNTGNMFIGSGLYNNFECAEKCYHPGFHKIPSSEFDNYYDLLAIPASNFVNNQTDLEDHFNYFSRTKVRMFCFGLGSQLLPEQEVLLKPGTERFLRLVSERSGSIGVRGAFTAEVLWNLGIRNLSIVGCPSLLSLGASQLERLARERPTLTKFCVNFSNNVRLHSMGAAAMKSSENDLFRRCISENSYYILQNEVPEISFLEAILAGQNDRAEACLDRICASFAVSSDKEDVRKYLAQRLRIFFNIPDWTACTSTMSASIGSRFHGNIAALMSGVPALFLVHDMRTRELCEFFHLPHVMLDRPYKAESLIERMLSVDYEDFMRYFAAIRTEWILFLNRNGLSVGLR